MCSEVRKNHSCVAEVLKYRPAVYNGTSREKYVYFSVLDPQSLIEGHPRLKRIRTKFNSYRTAKENRAAAMKYVTEVNKKLEEGWNPLIEDTSTKSFTIFDDVIKAYEKHLRKLEKDDVVKTKTYIDYSSRLKMLKKFMLEHPIIYIYMWDRGYIETFLEYVYIERDVSARTRNNYLTFLSSMSGWMVGCGYLKSNPCQGIKPLRNKEKFRKALSDEDREKLFKYLEGKDKYFLLACKFHYYTLVRPKEMAQIKIGDISVSNQSAFISASISKNRKDGVVTLPEVLLKLMIEMKVLERPSNEYLFSGKFMPGEKYRDSRQFTERWEKVREALHFPKYYQFYSLKDTGITDIINKVGLNVAKDQARHSSVAVTNNYASKKQQKAHPELLQFE